MALNIFPLVGSIARTVQSNAGKAAMAATALTASVSFIPRALTYIKDANTVSATQAAAKNTIVARVLIEDDISRLDIAPNLIRAAQSIYATSIMSILQQSSEISAGKTVSDALHKVSTRGMETYRDTVADTDEMTASIEKLVVSTPTVESAFMARLRGSEIPAMEDDASKAPLAFSFGVSNEGGVVAPPDLLPIGQVLKFTLTARDADGALEKIDTYLTIRMTPYIVAAKAMSVILSHGYKPGFKLRWLQWKAGEISFWKDLVFEADRIKRMEDAARADKTGAYVDFLADLGKRDRSRWIDVLSNIGDPRKLSNNLANTVIVTSEDTVKRTVADSNFDLNKHSDRQRFFKETYAMMLAIVDTNYHQVTLYLNGYDLPAHFAFSDFAPKKKMDGSDILQALTAVTGGAGRPARY